MIVISEEKKKLSLSPNAKRKNKAVQMLSKGNVVSVDTKGMEFKVKSQNEKNGLKYYSVKLCPELKLATCTCYDHQVNDVECKHILASKFRRHEMGYAV